MRHLSDEQTVAALLRGAAVEQMLTANLGDDILWLRVGPVGSRFALTRHHVRDDGSNDFLDVYEFAPVDDAEYIGEGRAVANFGDAPDALAAAAAQGAQPGLWVNSGGIQDEYARVRSSA